MQFQSLRVNKLRTTLRTFLSMAASPDLRRCQCVLGTSVMVEVPSRPIDHLLLGDYEVLGNIVGLMSVGNAKCRADFS